MVLVDILTAGNTDLDQGHLAAPFRAPREEEFEAQELVRHALDVVEAVNAKGTKDEQFNHKKTLNREEWIAHRDFTPIEALEDDCLQELLSVSA